MISILGLPYDADSSFLKGTAHGPPVIRNAFRSPSSNTYAENEVEIDGHARIVDEGDLELGSGQNARDQIESAIRNLVMQGHKVLSLGGDHSITYPVVRGYPDSLHVVHFDAHMDYAPFIHDLEYTNAHAFRHISPMAHVQSLTQVGIRSLRNTREMACYRIAP